MEVRINLCSDCPERIVSTDPPNMQVGTNTNDLLSQFKASSALSRLQLTLVSHNKYNSLLDHRFTVALQSGNDRRFLIRM